MQTFTARRLDAGHEVQVDGVVAVVEIAMTSFIALLPTSTLGAPWYPGFGWHWKYVNYTPILVVRRAASCCGSVARVGQELVHRSEDAPSTCRPGSRPTRSGWSTATRGTARGEHDLNLTPPRSTAGARAPGLPLHGGGPRACWCVSRGPNGLPLVGCEDEAGTRARDGVPMDITLTEGAGHLLLQARGALDRADRRGAAGHAPQVGRGAAPRRGLRPARDDRRPDQPDRAARRRRPGGGVARHADRARRRPARPGAPAAGPGHRPAASGGTRRRACGRGAAPHPGLRRREHAPAADRRRSRRRAGLRDRGPDSTGAPRVPRVPSTSGAGWSASSSRTSVLRTGTESTVRVSHDPPPGGALGRRPRRRWHLPAGRARPRRWVGAQGRRPADAQLAAYCPGSARAGWRGPSSTWRRRRPGCCRSRRPNGCSSVSPGTPRVCHGT